MATVFSKQVAERLAKHDRDYVVRESRWQAGKYLVWDSRSDHEVEFDPRVVEITEKTQRISDTQRYRDLYRGYDIDYHFNHELYHVFLDDVCVHSTESYDKACEWIDAKLRSV